MLQSMSLKGRDNYGYATEGVDVVPERKKEDVLATVVRLLKDANERLDRLLDEKERWQNRHQNLYQDYIALKFSDTCEHCKTVVEQNTAETVEVVLCERCKEDKQTIQGLKQEVERQEKLVRYWQECYETLLKHE